MSTRVPNGRQRRWLSGAGAALLAAFLVVSCSSDPLPAAGGGSPTPHQPGDGDPSCGTPNDGCPCATPQEQVDCGRVEQRSGDQVSCSVGKRTCFAGTWGPCAGTQIVTKSLAGLLGNSGDLSTLAITQGPCPPPPSPLSNPCDPYCNQVIDDATISLGGGPAGVCAYYEPADPAASYAALPASHKRLPAACAVAANDECGHDFFCGPPGGAPCTPFTAGQSHPASTGSCAASFELEFKTPCDNAGVETMAVCNRGGAPANAGVLKGLVYRDSLVGKPTNVSLHKAPVNAIIRGTCSVDLALNAIGPGTCVSFPRDTICPGVDWSGGGSNISTIQWNMADWTGVAPDPTKIAGECLSKNNFTVYDMGNHLACQGVGCAASSVTVKTTSTGNSGCGVPADNVHSGTESGGTACTLANQYTKCQQDFRCDVASGACLWNGGSGYYDPTVAGVDLTIGAACESPETVPICNRGSATVPAGTPINVHFPGPAPAPDACVVPGGPPDCSAPAPAAGLKAGQCMNIVCAIPGNKYGIVSGVAEPVGLCANNQAYVKTSGPPGCASCMFCDTRISGKVYDPSGATPTDPAATANNIALAGVSVFEPVGSLVNLDAAPRGPGVTCDTCASLDSPSSALTVTDSTGAFVLSGMTPGPARRVVVQSGRWRREITVPVTACAPNLLPAGTFRFPRTRTDAPPGLTADIPKMAVVAGPASCDSLACMLRRVGIAASEIQPRTGPAQLERVQYWRHAGGSAALNTVPSAPLHNIAAGLYTQPVIDEYAAVLESCYCNSGPDDYGNAQRSVALAYVNKGGRWFGDHWPTLNILSTGAIFPATATTWGGIGADGPATTPTAGHVVLGAAGSPQRLFRDWLPNANVLPLNYVDVAEPRNQARGPLAGTTEWIQGRGNNNWGAGAPPGIPTNASDYSLSYSFETAFGGTCGLPGGTGRVISNAMHTSGSRASLAAATFPGKCDLATALTDEERALEYQFFQLTACQLGGATPPPPPPPLASSTVFRDFEGICPVGTFPEWGFFFWQSITPPGSTVNFRAATASTQAMLPPLPPPATPGSVPIGTATGATVAPPAWASDANTVAVHLATDGVPPASAQKSRQWLRVYMKLNPIGSVSPSITANRIDYSCKPAE